MENGELFVMILGIQTMPAWSVDLSVLLMLWKLYHQLYSAKAPEPSFLMMSIALETNRVSLSARIKVLESVTVAIQKMLEFVV